MSASCTNSIWFNISMLQESLDSIENSKTKESLQETYDTIKELNARQFIDCPVFNCYKQNEKYLCKFLHQFLQFYLFSRELFDNINMLLANIPVEKVTTLPRPKTLKETSKLKTDIIKFAKVNSITGSTNFDRETVNKVAASIKLLTEDELIEYGAIASLQLLLLQVLDWYALIRNFYSVYNKLGVNNDTHYMFPNTENLFSESHCTRLRKGVPLPKSSHPTIEKMTRLLKCTEIWEANLRQIWELSKAAYVFQLYQDPKLLREVTKGLMEKADEIMETDPVEAKTILRFLYFKRFEGWYRLNDGVDKLVILNEDDLQITSGFDCMPGASQEVWIFYGRYYFEIYTFSLLAEQFQIFNHNFFQKCFSADSLLPIISIKADENDNKSRAQFRCLYSVVFENDPKYPLTLKQMVERIVSKRLEFIKARENELKEFYLDVSLD